MADANLVVNALLNADGYAQGANKVRAETRKLVKDVSAIQATQPDIWGAQLNDKTIKAFKATGSTIKEGSQSIFSSVQANALTAKAAIGDFGDETLSIFETLSRYPSVRYALYDAASELTRLGTVASAAGVAVVSASASYETALTGIQRTTLATGVNLETLRIQFLNLGKQIPLSFSDLTSIGTLGAQMGVAESDLAGFTKTVAEFSAVTNVSIESTAQAFGTLSNLLDVPASQFNNLGSAVALVGVKSVATESQILSVSEAIAGVTGQAGLSAEYTVGLSAALASLKVPAEQSRGALTRTFQEINRAVVEGGDSINAFAKIMGMTADEASNLAKQDMGKFFLSLNKGLEGMNPQQLTSALDSLNLSDVRVTNTLARLSNNMDLVNQLMGYSSEGYKNGAVLSALYSKKAEDLASKFQLLVNAVQEFASRVGDAVSPALKDVVDFITKIVNDINIFLTSDAGKAIATFSAIIGSAVAIFGLAAGAITALGASLLATRYVWTEVAGAIAIYKANSASSTTATTASTAAINANTASLAANTAAKRANASASTVGKTAPAAGALSFWDPNATKTVTDAGSAASGAASKLGSFASAAGKLFAPIAILTTVLPLLTNATKAVSGAFDITSLNTEEASARFATFVSDTSGLSAALIADKQAMSAAVAAGNDAEAQSYVKVNIAMWDNKDVADNSVSTIAKTADMLNINSSVLDSYSQSVQDNTWFVGDNTRAWIRNQMLQSKAIQQMASNADFMNYWNAIGADMNAAIDAAAADGERGVLNYFKNLEQTGTGAAAIAAGNISSVFFSGLNLQAGIFNNTAGSISDLAKGLAGQTGAMKLAGDETKKTTKKTSDFNDVVKKTGSSVKESQYFLTDYANDLAKIFGRAYDIRFSGTETLDKVTSSFAKIAKSTADARQEISDLSADIGSLQADKSLQEYFLSVANAYGDVLSAQKIKADIAKIDADLAKKQTDLAKAQAAASTELVGNSDAAIANRSEILNLVKSYQDHLKALAASGIKQDELRAKSEQLKQDFISQATQLGFNASQLGIYAVAFDDVKAAIDTVPRNLTVDFNGSEALTAIEEFRAQAQGKLDSIGAGGVGPNQEETDTKLNNTKSKFEEMCVGIDLANQALTKKLALEEQARQDFQNNEFSKGFDKLTQSLKYKAEATKQAIETLTRDTVDTVKRKIAELPTTGKVKYSFTSEGIVKNEDGYALGGYTGAGGKYDVAGIVHRGEYVVPKEQVNQMTGLPYYMSQPRSFFSGGFTGQSGPAMVSLSPEDRALLRGVGGSGEVVLYANNVELARSVNDGNRTIVAQGGRP